MFATDITEDSCTKAALIHLLQQWEHYPIIITITFSEQVKENKQTRFHKI